MKPIKALFDAAIIIHLAVVFNITLMPDGPYIWEETLLMIVIFYAVHWFMWRIILGSFGWYNFGEICHPIFLGISAFILALTLGLLFPSYDIDYRVDKDMSNEELAMNCPEAKWRGTLDYEAPGFRHDSILFYVEGDTETAYEKAQIFADTFMEEFPSCEITGNDIYLYWMPRQFCRDNKYSLTWSDPIPEYPEY